MTIGDKIKQRRIELGLSQDELAKKCGYKSRSSINKIELARDLPLNKVEKMAYALDVKPSYLMGWEDDIESKAELAADIYFNDDNITSFIEIYKKLNENNKNDLYLYANFLLSKQRDG